MQILSTIIVMIAATISFMPPQWCRALPVTPIKCCQACQDEESEEKQESPCGSKCECGTKAIKQSEETPSLDYQAVAISFDIENNSISENLLAVVVDDRPPINRQRILCRWLC